MNTKTPRVAAGLAACVLSVSSAFAGEPVLCEPFDDGLIDPGWTIVGSDLGVIAPVEQNGRLEFPAAPVGPSEAFAGILSLWAIDALQDFRVKVDYALNPPASGEAGVSFAVIFSGNIPDKILIDGVTLDVGTEPQGPFACASVFIGGNDFEGCDLPLGAGTSIYIWYDAADDEIFGSYVGFDDPQAPSAVNLRALSGADRVRIYVGGFVAQNAPAVPGADLFVDDLCVEDGLVIPAPAGDLNGDGVVDTVDLLQMLGAWGPCVGECPSDLNGDGFTDVVDLLIMLGAWG